MHLVERIPEEASVTFMSSNVYMCLIVILCCIRKYVCVPIQPTSFRLAASPFYPFPQMYAHIT